jgi:hypothetical protein
MGVLLDLLGSGRRKRAPGTAIRRRPVIETEPAEEPEELEALVAE